MPCTITDSVHCSALFNRFVLQHALDQLVMQPTRGEKVLDLVLTNEPFLINNVEVCSPFSTSDHNSVEFQIILNSANTSYKFSSKTVTSRPNFNMADWHAIELYMQNVDWNYVFSECTSCAEVSDRFYAVVNECIQLYVPLKAVKHGKAPKRHYPPFVRKAINKKRQLWKTLRKFRTPELTARYRVACKACRAAVN